MFRHLPEKTSNLTTESLNNMPYMRAVFKEALRLNPVLAGNGRMAGRDIVLEGYQVPKDVSCVHDFTESGRKKNHDNSAMY